MMENLLKFQNHFTPTGFWFCIIACFYNNHFTPTGFYDCLQIFSIRISSLRDFVFIAKVIKQGKSKTVLR